MRTRWSEITPSARHTLAPDLGIRDWGSIPKSDKETMLKFAENKGWFTRGPVIYYAVFLLNEDNKQQAFGRHLLSHGGPHKFQGMVRDCCTAEALKDFRHVFVTEHQDVAYELISNFAANLSDSQYEIFRRMFNDLSDQFGFNILFSETGITPRQEPRITNEIYFPVLLMLGEPKWEPVSRDFGDAFADFLRATPESYSSCITHALAGLQAFMQILVNGATGSGDLAVLLKKAETSGLLPDDQFSKTTMKAIISALMQERQDKGDPHPKNQYANEKSARLVLNLSMVFMQHILQD